MADLVEVTPDFVLVWMVREIALLALRGMGGAVEYFDRAIYSWTHLRRGPGRCGRKT